MADKTLNRASKKALIDFLVDSLKLEEGQARIFVEGEDIRLKKQEVLEKPDKELATKDFLRVEISGLEKRLVELDKKFTVYFTIIIITILITNPNVLDLIQRIFA